MKSPYIDTKMDWDVWEASIDTDDEINKKEKKEAKKAIRYMKSITGSALDGDYPILRRVYRNQASWAITWLIELADTIKLISTKKGVDI